MCSDCVDLYGGRDPGTDTPDVRAVAAKVHAFYRMEGCSVGGPLHIVLDDYNVEDDCIDWCLEHAVPEHGDEVQAAARELAAMLRHLTEGQRALALELADPYGPD